MDLLGSLKPQTTVPGLGQDLPGRSTRLPGSKPTGEDPAASFDSFLPAAKPAAVVTDDTSDLPTEGASLASPSLPVARSSLSSVPRTARKLVKTRTDLAETGTDSSETAFPSASSSTSTASAASAPAKSAIRAPQARPAATPAPAVANPLVQSTPAPSSVPAMPTPTGDRTPSVTPDPEPDSEVPVPATSVATALPIASQLTASAPGPVAALPTPVPTTAPIESVPTSPAPAMAFAPVSTSAVNSGPVPLSVSGFAAPKESVPLSPELSSVSGSEVPETGSEADASVSVLYSVGYTAESESDVDETQSGSVSAGVSSRSASLPRRMQLGAESVPISVPASANPAKPMQSVPVAAFAAAPVAGSVPVSTTVPTPVGTAFAVESAAGGTGTASGSVPVRSRSWAVTAAYRNSARQPEEVASTDSDEVEPSTPVATYAANRVANIADPLPPSGTPAPIVKSGSDKNSINNGDKQVTEVISRAGTSIAQSSAVPTSSSSNSSSAASSGAVASPHVSGRDGAVATSTHPLAVVSGSTFPSFASASAASDRSAASITARDAVATVVKLAEAQQTRSDANAGSINLGFKFGDEHLGVRVELRSGQIHTQFTTSSPELREALSNQFVSLTGGAGSSNSGSNGSSDRPYAFAQPEFTGAGSSTADQRGPGQDTPQAPAEFALEGFAPTRAADVSPDSGAPTTLPATPLSSSSDLHLHAFA